MKNELTIQDLKDCFFFAKKRDGKLNKKQIKILSDKANNSINIEKDFFWDWFVKKYGVPNINQKGFSAKREQFSFYYFEYLNK